MEWREWTVLDFLRWNSEQVNHTHRPDQTDLFVIIWLDDNASEDQSVICQREYKAPLAVISDPVLC